MTMAHPNEELLRNAYATFARGDIEGYWQMYAEDFAFHVPGRGQMAGTYKGKDQFFGMIGKVMQLTGDAFQEEVHDVVANDEHGVVLATHRFERNGRQREYRTAHVYHIRDGKPAECWEQPQDQYFFDEAWR
jgi:ketosteroid isomerase-like protein